MTPDYRRTRPIYSRTESVWKRSNKSETDHSGFVLKAIAHDIAKKASECIEDEELRIVIEGLLIREYYSNKKLYEAHKERYYK